jgi:hypothetical protein
MVSPAHRPVSTRRFLLALATVAAVLLALPLGAGAATTHFAAPTGAGPAPCTDPTAPCNIETAVESGNIADGDTILLAPGTYHPAVSLKVFRSVTISGSHEAGRPAPLIEAAGEYGLFMQDPSTVRDLRIKSPPGTTAGLFMLTAGSMVDRVESVGEANRACVLIGALASDSVCSATPALGGGEGVEMSLSGPTPSLTETRLTNVTAVGGYAGISVAANESTALAVNATNTIASGGQFDIVALSFAPTAPVSVNLSHSNFEDFETEATGAHVTAPTEAGNQTAAPFFVDEAGGDYREQEGSPTRLAGDLGVVSTIGVDLVGNPRTTNCAGTVGVDIGAYQYECLPPVTPPNEETKPDNPITTPIVTSPAPLPTEPAPSLSKLALKPSKFTVGGKAPNGTTISYTLSTAATVKFEVLGKKTVKGKKKTVTLGTLTLVQGKAGANSVKFNGKVKGKPLAPGSYTLKAIASGTAGSSKPSTATFTVLAATG